MLLVVSSMSSGATAVPTVWSIFLSACAHRGTAVGTVYSVTCIILNHKQLLLLKVHVLEIGSEPATPFAQSFRNADR
jgi:hypothetical protein